MAAKKKTAAKAAPRADEPAPALTPMQGLAALCEIQTGEPAGKGLLARSDVESFVEALPDGMREAGEDALAATHPSLGALSAAYAVKAAITGLVD